MFQNKDKDLLGIYKHGCDPICVSLLTDRHLKVRSNTDFVMISRQRHVYVCTWIVASRVAHELHTSCTQKVSNFRRSDRDNYFVIGKKPSRKQFEKNNTNFDTMSDFRTINIQRYSSSIYLPNCFAKDFCSLLIWHKADSCSSLTLDLNSVA